MNGPEHYREAERLLKVADRSWETEVNQNTVIEWDQDTLLAAQVHAALALAAATAHAAVGLPEDGDTSAAWRNTIIATRIRNSGDDR